MLVVLYSFRTSFQIKSVTILQPRLTATLPTRLTDAFNSLPHLHNLTIRSPTAINGLPHPTLVSCLKLVDLPQYSEDWRWVASIKGLEEIEVSFVKADVTSQDSGHVECAERLHIHGDKAESKYMFADGTGNIFANLPKETLVEVTGFFFFDLNA